MFARNSSNGSSDEVRACAAQFGKQSAVGAAAVATTRDPIFTTIYQVIARLRCNLAAAMRLKCRSTDTALC